MIGFEDYERHQHATNKIAREALKQVAKNFQMPYSKVLVEFRDNEDLEITADFWHEVRARHGDEYNGVIYCHGCKKFNLYHQGVLPHEH
ncbi:hypothetical protein HNR62_003207 [Oceanisphaera litoralis]|uniref:hypothetical protein n=1 Tax=Oceanisphaera litoralis TaxID=225144 RepID=UPI001956F003|nr:hypothetical protein [Oceanisphaera litoralis]MBM7457295.1 hypothetical protein [Oceanisphaera litoralis]